MKLNFATGGALAALAAALALTAVPADAREGDRYEHHGRHQQADGDSGQRVQRWGGRDQPTARPDRAAPQAQEPRTYAPRARSDQQQRGWSGQDRPQQPQRSWSREAPQQQRSWSREDRPQQPQRNWTQRQQTQRWGGDAQRTERNRTYVDPNRTTTYRNTDRNWRDGRRDNDRNWRDGNRDGRQWNRTWRNDNRYDWQRYRTTNRNAYHIGRYYSPYRNYSYRRLSIGFGLDSLFYSSRYWINDPWQYRLPEAYGPYRWVRYYDDALLVDIYSGEVVDVIYDFFW